MVSGCGGVMENPYNFSDEEIAEAAEKIQAWPSLEDTERLVTDVVVKIGEVTTEIAPAVQFRWHRERTSGGGCPGPFAYTDGLSITTQSLLSDVPIGDADWQAVLDAAREIATEAGIDQIEVLVDQPGRHDVTFFSADGNRITFGTFKAASIRAITGCRRL
ncbi:hypothetical protein BFN03_13415 [Rhodococcus sp. WMMA185]|nr:hypothetical protein BFN03_13415 [Rhodococcus sp. WMMA185]